MDPSVCVPVSSGRRAKESTQGHSHLVSTLTFVLFLWLLGFHLSKPLARPQHPTLGRVWGLFIFNPETRI